MPLSPFFKEKWKWMILPDDTVGKQKPSGQQQSIPLHLLAHPICRSESCKKLRRLI